MTRSIAKLAPALLAAFSVAWPMEHKATADELDRAKVEEAIHDYILNHPEIIRDAIVEMQRHEQADKEKAALAALENNRALLLASPHQAVIGNPNGDISIVEFFDYNCPYCRQSAPDLASVLAQDKNVRVVLKEWPILGPDSIEAAKVSIAARILDGGARFQEFHEKLLAIHGRANRTNAIQVATSVGYDSQRIESEIESDEVKSTIAEVAQLGTTLNITGTPSFIAGSRAIAGAMDVNGLKRVVARARQECKTPSC